METVTNKAVRILIIEDNPGDKDLVEYYLETVDVFTVEPFFAETISGAKAVIKNQKLDLIFADLNLPDSNGLNTLKKLMEMVDEIPVIVMTGLSDKHMGIEAIRMGAEDYLVKDDLSTAVIEKAVLYARERSLLKEKIRQLVYQDSASKLFNRRAVYEILGKQLAHEAEIAEHSLIKVKLHGIEEIYDSLGHILGDNVLKAVAQKLKDIVGNKGFVGNLSNSEFVLFINGIGDDEYIQTIILSIESFSRAPFVFDNFEIFVSCTYGIAVFPEHGSSIEELLQNAGIALTYVKSVSSQSYQYFTKEMRDEHLFEFRLSNDLVNAIDRNELLLNYQPIVNTITGDMEAVEVLLRWVHSELGNISPAVFIPIAEKTGQIISIGEWVLGEACKTMTKWMADNDYQMYFSVNVSLYQLMKPDFSEVLCNILKETNLDPRYLVLEITESISARSIENVTSMLSSIGDQGVRLSIDDFGSGYSSIKQIQILPIDVLKIDKTFVDEIETDNFDSRMIKSVISLAQSLNLKTVAEGVETARQLAFLQLEGCDLIQGYYFSKPVRLTELSTKPFIEKVSLSRKRQLKQL
ncbi:GGDEF domain-containing response regulator [Eubacteriaceae bacterium ES3]|nr:GGDEF domain-containing response regulator [Eubacteriaceae bacterium ES3]